MVFRVLKIARVVISLIVFLLITFVFIDFTAAFSSGIIRGILYLEFVPSLVSFIGLAGMAAAGFLFVLLLSFLFGRLYCSTLCPLGTLQDILIWLRRRFSRKRIRYKKQRSFFYLSYALLFLAALFLLLGWITPLLFLDPYSHYGRIAANLIRPVYLLLNNLGAVTLESLDIYTLYRVEPGVTHWFSVSFATAIFILVTWLSLRYARLFCNSLCPVGTLLGLVSRVSVFRISLDKSLCTSCGKCTAVCKAGCIDKDARKVDFSRCVVCFNCLTSCPDNGVVFNLRGTPPKAALETYNPGRREALSVFLAGGLVVAGTSLLANPQGFGRRQHGRGQGRKLIPVNREYPVSPPGSISQEHFNASCTACHLCVSVCPTHVIKPSLLQYGLAGIMQPVMDYNASFCNFDCVACTEICPTGALRPVSVEEKHTLQLGKVYFIKQNCVVFTDGTDCGACSEHCPTKAVKMKPWRGNLFLPEVEPDICVGCGACEYACPTDPKSIYVDGNPVHLVASKPKIEALEQPDPEEDFPF